MKRLTLLLILLFISELKAIDDKNNDFQLWLYTIAKKKISDNLIGTASVSSRRDNNATRLYEYYYEFGCSYRLTDTLWLGPSVREAYVKRRTANQTTEWNANPQLFLSLIKSWSWQRFELSDRNQIHYSYHSRKWSYRNRFRLYYEAAFSPFISDEFFVLEGKRLHQNRLQIGLIRAFAEGIEGSIAYMLRSKESQGGWINQNILVLQLLAQF